MISPRCSVAEISPETNRCVLCGYTAGPAAAVAVEAGVPAGEPRFDQAAREGRAKEQRRRASGNEPRVYGIAPRTDRDLTWQMPDDPIIRY